MFCILLPGCFALPQVDRLRIRPPLAKNCGIMNQNKFAPLCRLSVPSLSPIPVLSTSDIEIQDRADGRGCLPVLDAASAAKSAANFLRTSALSSFTKSPMKLEEVYSSRGSGAENLHFHRLTVVCRASPRASTLLSSHWGWKTDRRHYSRGGGGGGGGGEKPAAPRHSACPQRAEADDAIT